MVGGPSRDIRGATGQNRQYREKGWEYTPPHD
jgi:hypothetical protein